MDEPSVVFIPYHQRPTTYPYWCLVHNIATAAGLKVAHEQGWWDGTGYHKRNP